MRTSEITIADNKYLACFSTRVLVAIEEREGDGQKGLQRILADGKTSDLFWLLAQMIDAGDRYARHEGLENPGVLTEDELLDLVGVDDYNTMFGAIAQAVQRGNTPEVEVRPAKNAKTTPSK